MIDFHSHFLPKIDDGSQSSETSIQMLEASREYGVETMVATPHFYINKQNADRFLEKRQASYEALKKHIKEQNADVPNIILGAEVYYFRGISHYDMLDKLKIGDTDCILIEMPFDKWNSKVLDEISELKDMGLIPVIAHIDRYLGFQSGTDNIDRLVSMDIPIQMNADFVNSFFTKGKAARLVNDGVVRVLGSDCHNMDKRKPNLGECVKTLQKKCGAQAVDDIYEYSKKLLHL